MKKTKTPLMIWSVSVRYEPDPDACTCKGVRCKDGTLAEGHQCPQRSWDKPVAASTEARALAAGEALFKKLYPTATVVRVWRCFTPVPYVEDCPVYEVTHDYRQPDGEIVSVTYKQAGSGPGVHRAD